MGAEFGQQEEWDHDKQISWKQLDDPLNKGISTLVGDLNRLYSNLPALHELDCEEQGFEWIDGSDKDQSVVSFIRRAKDSDEFVVFVCNFTPVVREKYKLGVPKPGKYLEIFNSDSSFYHGSDVGNGSEVEAFVNPKHGQPCSLNLTLPPLAGLIFRPKG